MTNLVKIENLPAVSDFSSKEEADQAKKNVVWKSLAAMSVGEAIEDWLKTLDEKPHTQKAYRLGMKRLFELELISPGFSLQVFSLVNHNSIIDQIKIVQEWSKGTRQARAACYISFTGFLARRTDGMVLKAIPCKEGVNKTFSRIHSDGVVTKSLNRKQWNVFFEALHAQNPRDALIGKLMLQGGKRVSEVLSSRIDNINWEEREITFIQAKTRDQEESTIITYPERIMQQIKELIRDRRSGYIFLTRNSKRIHPGQIERSFARAGRTAGFSFKVTTHVMRASTVTYLKENGFSDSDIMKITGHKSSEMIAAYDKGDKRNNATKVVNFVQD